MDIYSTLYDVDNSDGRCRRTPTKLGSNLSVQEISGKRDLTLQELTGAGHAAGNKWTSYLIR